MESYVLWTFLDGAEDPSVGTQGPIMLSICTTTSEYLESHTCSPPQLSSESFLPDSRSHGISLLMRRSLIFWPWSSGAS